MARHAGRADSWTGGFPHSPSEPEQPPAGCGHLNARGCWSIIRRTGKDAGIDVRGAEEMKVNPLAQDYGEALVGVSFTCRIEQLINFMADLANRPELLATSDIRISAASANDKTINVRLGLSGVVARKLVPAKKGPASS